jgi:translation initiation factor IF-2
MVEVTVRQFAEVVGIPVDRLLEQLADAGMQVADADQIITEREKTQLLGYLRSSRGDNNGDPRKITLKRKSTSELRLAGAQGRSKTVTVEVRKQRTYIKRSETAEESKPDLEEELKRQLELERAALEEQRLREEEEAQRREEEEAQARLQAEAEEARRREEEEAQARLQAEAEEARRREEEKTQRRVTPPANNVQRARPAPHEPIRQNTAAPAALAPADDAKARDKSRRDVKKGRTGEQGDKYGREDLHLDAGARRKKSRKPELVKQHRFERPTQPVVHEVSIPQTITVGELAQRMAVKAGEVIKTLMGMGVMATINQSIEQDTAILVVEELGHVAKALRENELEEALVTDVETQSAQGEQASRSPIVTVMGHVDHGKTTLLDYIRRTRVAAKEAGGITQHIGAYHVETERGMITFLDTPGHEAFASMRARGAQLTDIVILVVAADDGLMPQAIEAIQHARAAKVPIIVAINKIDKPDADLDRVRNDLATQDVISEDWGGDTMFVPVSAKTGQGVDDLLESILVQAEVMELKAVADAPARGVVIESSLEKGRGSVATILIQEGTLRRGDIIICGCEWGRVRAMFDEQGRNLKSAGPSMPAQILGLSGVPNAGDQFVVLSDERKARELADSRRERMRDVQLSKQQVTNLDDVFNRLEEGRQQTLNLIIKADVQGSVEALRDSLTNLSNAEVNVRVVSSGVGGITESDVNLAVTSQAIIMGFNVRMDSGARRLAQEHGVDVRYYSVIYEAINELRNAITGLMKPVIREEIVGLAAVRDVFRSSKMGQVAGCLVEEGVMRRNNPIRVLRNNVVIFEGELESLRRFKDDVNEVRAGTECGIAVKNYNDVRAGDRIEVYERKEVKAEA